MMTPEAPLSGRTRVSILERLVPAFAFVIAAISGAIGALMIFRFLSSMKRAETAGYAAFFGGVVEIELVVGGILIFAAVLCAIGILVSIIRLFTANTTSSPPGVLFLLAGFLSLVPPFAVHYVLHLMKGAVASPGSGGVSMIAGTVTAVSYFAIGSAAVIALVALALASIPFSSRAGRKASPLVCLMLVEILIVVLMGVYFWEARTSLVERDRDRDRTGQFSTPSESPSANSDRPLPGTVDDVLTDVNNSSSPGKTISGGVLNSKAIELPEPEYPASARAVRATGSVSVQVTVDEKGEVVSASALSGHPLLRASAVQAARQAKFKPTMFSGQPVKVTGILTFNFSGQ